MSDDTRSESLRANSPQKDFDKSRDIRAERIAKASPEAKQQIDHQRTLEKQLLEKEEKQQKRYREFRYQKTRAQMLEDYLKNPALRPDGVQPQDISIINQNARHKVKQSENYFLNQIRQNTDKQIDVILDNDKPQQHTAQKKASIQKHVKHRLPK
jgi:hypothetical protein